MPPERSGGTQNVTPRAPLWRCANPRCEDRKAVVEPTSRGRCPTCGRTVYATWPENRR